MIQDVYINILEWLWVSVTSNASFKQPSSTRILLISLLMELRFINLCNVWNLLVTSSSQFSMQFTSFSLLNIWVVNFCVSQANCVNENCESNSPRPCFLLLNHVPNIGSWISSTLFEIPVFLRLVVEDEVTAVVARLVCKWVGF